MATFVFKALDLSGSHTRGEVEADTKQAVSAQLRAKGLIVLDIEEHKSSHVGDLLGRFKRVKATALTVLIALVTFLVPVFEKIFKDFGGSLPSITKFTVMLSHIMTHQWYLVIGSGALSVVGFVKWKKTERGLETWDKFKLKVPWKIGDIVQKVCLA